MTTIKSYTDLSQSKTLSKILLFESADMYWDYEYSIYTLKYKYYPRVMDDKFDDVCIPCWSLAALLDVLPNEIITVNNRFKFSIRKYDGGNKNTLYQIAYGSNKSSSGSWHDMINTGEKENLIDCCVQMILKLYEFKML